MKGKLLTLLLVLIAAVAVRANDGVFYASGATLVPLQETRITLRRESLKFFVFDHGYLRVEVDFEFYNPAAARTLTVGFVTPPSQGDFEKPEAGHPFITDFTVNVNGSVIPYKMNRLAKTSFRKGNVNVSGRDWVYYFQAPFKRGVNRVRHTYRFRGAASVELQRSFDYQITTGKRWANRRIDEFELEIHPDNGIFALIASFQKNGRAANWEIVGDGVMEKKTREWFSDESPRVHLFHLNSGYIRFKARNFSPDNDLFFGEYNWPAGWTGTWCQGACFDNESLEKAARFFSLKPYTDFDPEYIEELSSKELRYVRNYFYALRGLPFRDPELGRFFGQFFWYKPVPDLRSDEIVLSGPEEAFLRRLQAVEAKRKN